MNENEVKINPKCSICKSYYIQTFKLSGQPYKCCNKCLDINRKKHQEYKCEHNKRKDR
jgi:hypothetical protein